MNPSSHVSESFRSLRTYIRQLGLLKGPGGQVLLFTSAESGEGKTTILSNLAVSFVQDGKKVAVVDCNLRKPGLHSVFDVEGSQGLAAYLSGYEEAKDVLVYGSLANLAVIPAGVSTVSPPDLLGSERMAGLLTELKASFDLILLDSPRSRLQRCTDSGPALGRGGHCRQTRPDEARSAPQAERSHGTDRCKDSRNSNEPDQVEHRSGNVNETIGRYV